MPNARITVDDRFTVAPVSRRLFGSFVEHLGRCVYDGIYEPAHPTADADGFRQDVIDLVRELGISTIRYPGGNFVSGYQWEDGVGPREERPRRLDLAWHSVETNQVGLHEFTAWNAKVGTELMIAVNLGTRGVRDALNLLEYSNVAAGSALSDQRIGNGARDPFDIKLWCLGNEMDGPWQLGHSSPEAYGALASQTAKAMRQLDPTVELVVCGSSNSRMPTFGTWERVVLELTYDDIDYISCHAYYEELDGDLGSFLASGRNMDYFIESVVATADHVKAVKRSDKTVNISFDEWNVWYARRYHNEDEITDPELWPYAPRLLEDAYSVADAVVVGSLLISLLRHSDRVTAASLAQLVNVIAPIMTEPGGDAWRQTTFFPFAITSRLAHGEVLDVRIASDTYDTAANGEVDLVDAVATHGDSGLSIFLVNRGQDAPTSVTIDVRGLSGYGSIAAETLSDDDIYATNSLEQQDRVGMRELEYDVTDGLLAVKLPPVSWSVITLAV